VKLMTDRSTPSAFSSREASSIDILAKLPAHKVLMSNPTLVDSFRRELAITLRSDCPKIVLDRSRLGPVLAGRRAQAVVHSRALGNH
jgi:hypothetical protein